MKMNPTTVTDFDEPPTSWDTETVTFDSEETWSVFGRILVYKQRVTQNIMADPDVPKSVYKSMEVNLNALTTMLKQYKMLDEKLNSVPITFQFNEPVELTQAIFACQYGKRGVKNKSGIDEQSIKCEKSEIDKITEILAEIHWDDDIIELANNVTNITSSK